jgi:predicted HTH transcriptional regulator
LIDINGSAGSLHRLLQNGESENLEFKSSLRSPMQGELPNKEIRNVLEFSCVKSVAAMLHNKSGGKLLIGVSDDGECVGLEKDYESSEKIGNRDGFELHFRRVLQQKIEGLLPSEVKISFETVNNKDVAVILCPPASSPKYVNHENRTYLFVRDGNATIDLVSDIKKLVAFTTSRFTTSK